MARKPQRKSKLAARAPSVEDFSYSPRYQILLVTFHGGRTYRYRDVPPEIAVGLAKAPSKGAFMHASVLGKFDATKL